MENIAKIVLGEGQNQLQIDVGTYIRDEKRQKVLCHMALRQVIGIETEVATMEADELNEIHRVLQEEMENTEVETQEEAPSLILGPDFAPAR
jgi:hypothetical protein